MSAPLGWPFDDEPPLEHGVVDDIAWAIKAGGPPGMRVINGYARIPWEGHPWSGCADYDDLDVQVHGGLTFGPTPAFDFNDFKRAAEDLIDLTADTDHPFVTPTDGLSAVPARTFAECGGWIGFDTAHYRDYWSDEALREWDVDPGQIPGFDRERLRFGDHQEIRWTGALVIEQAKDLARQIAAVRRPRKVLR